MERNGLFMYCRSAGMFVVFTYALLSLSSLMSCLPRLRIGLPH